MATVPVTRRTQLQPAASLLLPPGPWNLMEPTRTKARTSRTTTTTTTTTTVATLVGRTAFGGLASAIGLSLVLLVAAGTAGQGPPLVEGSTQQSAIETPSCEPPGRWRTKQRLDYVTSKRRGASIDDRGLSFISSEHLKDCANWCCKLPAINCSAAILEIKPTGANCHLLSCYPSELCVFVDAPGFVTYDRTLFALTENSPSNFGLPSEASEATTASDGLRPEVGVEGNAPMMSSPKSVEGGVAFRVSPPTGPQRDPQRDSAIKPRKGVDAQPPASAAAPDGDDAQTPTKTTTTGKSTNKSDSRQKRQTPVGTIFLYAAILLAFVALVAFFGQKFLDCWERRHYTRADYLLDGMYEDRPAGLKEISN